MYVKMSLLYLLGVTLTNIMACSLSPESDTRGQEELLRSGQCDARNYGFGSVACVCNAEFCDDDSLDPSKGLLPGQVLRVVSSKDGRRLEVHRGSLRSKLDNDDLPRARLRVMSVNKRRQEIFGFGGALTDSAALLMRALPRDTRRRLLQQLFGTAGARFTVVRVPMAGTDFSTRNYTYDNSPEPDAALDHFALQPEDLDLKIPILQEISQMVHNDELKLYAVPWSAPPWMVENGEKGKNHLLFEYYQSWANYFIKFLDAYTKHDLEFWAISTQNEPSDGYITSDDYEVLQINRLGWSPEQMGYWIHHHLGPTLHRRGYGHLKVMIHDDQRDLLPDWPLRILNDSDTNSYVSGIAVHWYLDKSSSPSLLTDTHKQFPDKFLLYTEASDGAYLSGGPAVQLGNWTRAENYAKDIIDATNNWVTGWLDWNLVLDPNGGPSWKKNYLDASIIVNVSSSEFLKQPTFYALAHFSRFVPRGSFFVPWTWEDTAPKAIDATAFRTPDDDLVLVLLNREEVSTEVLISSDDSDNCIYVSTLLGQSITTLVIRSQQDNWIWSPLQRGLDDIKGLIHNASDSIADLAQQDYVDSV